MKVEQLEIYCSINIDIYCVLETVKEAYLKSLKHMC